MSDLISRQDVVNEIHKYFVEEIDKTPTEIDEDGDEVYTDMPTVNSLLTCNKKLSKRIKALPSAEAVQGEWIPLSHDYDGLVTDFPYERDGEWVIVTDGKTISVERIKKDAYDHFFPNGRWFQLEDVIAWIPLPEQYKGGDDE